MIQQRLSPYSWFDTVSWPEQRARLTPKPGASANLIYWDVAPDGGLGGGLHSTQWPGLILCAVAVPLDQHQRDAIDAAEILQINLG